jgi:hypothetical protein
LWLDPQETQTEHEREQLLEYHRLVQKKVSCCKFQLFQAALSLFGEKIKLLTEAAGEASVLLVCSINKDFHRFVSESFPTIKLYLANEMVLMDHKEITLLSHFN